MRYVERPFGPPLDRWIECAWMAEDDGTAGAPQTIVPDGCPELILQLGDAFEELGARGSAVQPRLALVGPQPGPWRVRPLGRVRTFGVRFRPGGLAAFTPIPLAELAGRSVAAEMAFGRTMRGGLDRLSSARTMDARTGAVEELLRPLAAGERLPRAAGAAVSLLLATRGRAGIHQVARRLSVSTRHLERLFAAAVGLRPKRLARILRLQEVLRRAHAAEERWVDVALDSGYTDQAHLVRDFRELAGDTPARWLHTSGDLALQFTARPRLDAFFA